MQQILALINPTLFLFFIQTILPFCIIPLRRARIHWCPMVITIRIITVTMSSSFTLWFRYKQINSVDFNPELFSNRLLIFGLFSTLGFVLQIIGYCSFFHFIYKRREYLRNLPSNPDSGFHEAIKNKNDIID